MPGSYLNSPYTLFIDDRAIEVDFIPYNATFTGLVNKRFSFTSEYSDGSVSVILYDTNNDTYTTTSLNTEDGELIFAYASQEFVIDFENGKLYVDDTEIIPYIDESTPLNFKNVTGVYLEEAGG